MNMPALEDRTINTSGCHVKNLSVFKICRLFNNLSSLVFKTCKIYHVLIEAVQI